MRMVCLFEIGMNMTFRVAKQIWNAIIWKL